MSAHADTIRRAHATGWRVTEGGTLLRPDGSVEPPRLRRDAEIDSRRRYYYTCIPRAGFGNGTLLLHKLAAYCWFGDAALVPGVHVRHLDGDSLNNSRANLALGSQSDNMLDRPPARRRRIALQAASARRSLTPSQVRELVAEARRGVRQKDLTERHGLRKSTVSEILSGKIYSEVTGITQKPRTRTEVPAHLREVA